MEQKCEKQLEKLTAIKDINLHQLDIVDKMTEVALKPSSPYPKVNRRRMFSIMAMTIELRYCSTQIDIIKSQPTQDFAEGGAIVSPKYRKHEK